jgi:hypothetical protein
VGSVHLLHKKNHHRIERWIPSILITYGTVGAIHNAIVLSDADNR